MAHGPESQEGDDKTKTASVTRSLNQPNPVDSRALKVPVTELETSLGGSDRRRVAGVCSSKVCCNWFQAKKHHAMPPVKSARWMFSSHAWYVYVCERFDRTKTHHIDNDVAVLDTC